MNQRAVFRGTVIHSINDSPVISSGRSTPIRVRVLYDITHTRRSRRSRSPDGDVADFTNDDAATDSRSSDTRLPTCELLVRDRHWRRGCGISRLRVMRTPFLVVINTTETSSTRGPSERRHACRIITDLNIREISFVYPVNTAFRCNRAITYEYDSEHRTSISSGLWIDTIQLAYMNDIVIAPVLGSPVGFRMYSASRTSGSMASFNGGRTAGSTFFD